METLPPNVKRAGRGWGKGVGVGGPRDRMDCMDGIATSINQKAESIISSGTGYVAALSNAPPTAARYSYYRVTV